MENNEETLTHLAKIEALLFVSSGLVSINHLSKALDISEAQVEGALADLETHYKMGGHGLRLMRVKSRVQLTTDATLSKTVEDFLGLQSTATLSQAALETLAILAYKQPITRPEVDVIRGVNSDGVMRTLLSKGLIEELGRAETPGRPIYYGTSPEFLQYFGLESLETLPFIDFDALEDNLNGNAPKEVLKT
ncbi:MAG TPA: SMC-Scp complex subunit ScpB [Anaerolineaceae bacterium]|jgi:segregation and condensation protein B|nr:SMC-Scp complex subunit ScpB [Anaerolineaceae bacterium]